ncbi:MAG: SIMPL domain-containing protein [Candidatus Dormibacteraeota bacterium]|nr:SIMPL domain-containing protein [Candidatus Dormibacteraeota bacterium]
MAEQGAVLTVRGEATRRVAPDVAVLTGSLGSVERSKAEATAAVAAAQERLTAELSRLGGVPLTLESEREALTWSAYTTSTQLETRYNPKTQRHEETGRVIATVRVMISARDLGRLKELSAALAHHETFHLHYVAWQVDEENPGWSEVRQDAIHAAVRRAHDYAHALGASLVTVEQVADTGLLEDRPRSDMVAGSAPLALASRTAGPEEDAEAPSLDPVPQEVFAMVEARFRTSPATLAD